MPPGFIPWRNLLRDFQSNYPKINIELYLTERKVDLVEDGIDVALRIGNTREKQAVAQKIGEYQHLLVASPILFKDYDVPHKPVDLLKIPCASWKSPNDSSNWQLGHELVQINPFFQVNDYLHLLDLALAGKCVTELPPFLAHSHFASKQLKHLLPNYSFPSYEISLLYPSRKQLSRLVTTYVDFCSKRVIDLGIV